MRTLAFVLILLSSAAPAWAQQASTPKPDAAKRTALDALIDADVAWHRGNCKDAIPLFREAVQLDERSSLGYAGLVACYLRDDNVKDAAEAAQKGMAAGARASIAHVTMGQVLFRLGKLDAAEREFQNALHLNTNDAGAYFGLYRLYNAISYRRRALSMLEKAHTLDASGPQIAAARNSQRPAAERIAELEKTAAAEPDPSRATRAREELAKMREANSGICRMVTKVEPTEMPLKLILSGPERLRGWGLQVIVNGTPSTLLLDSGAGGMLISRGLAGKAGVKQIGETRISGLGDKGPVEAWTGMAESIKVGNLEFRNCLVAVANGTGLDDGVIAPSVFSDYMITLDFPAAKFKLGPLPQRPEESGRAPRLEGTSPESAEEEAQDPYHTSETEGFSQAFRFGNHLLVPTTIGAATPKLFMLDTGASATLISPDAAKEVTKIGRDFDTQVRGVSGTVKKVYVGDRVMLGFGRLKQENVDFLVMDLGNISRRAGVEVSGILGMTALRNLTVRIDYRDGLVEFQYDPKRLPQWKMPNP